MCVMPLAIDTVNYCGRGAHPPPLRVANRAQRNRPLRHDRDNEAGCASSSKGRMARIQAVDAVPALETMKSRNRTAAFSPPACAGSRDASCITPRRGGWNVFLEETEKSYEDRRGGRDRPRTYPTARLFREVHSRSATLRPAGPRCVIRNRNIRTNPHGIGSVFKQFPRRHRLHRHECIRTL